MEKVKLTIDGLEISADKDKTILQAALENDIYIPHLCYHPDLEKVAVCRVCMVDVAGRGLTISCRAPVEEGLVVKTDSEELKKVRKVPVQLLFANHKTDCITCGKNDDCELQRIAKYLGLEADELNRLRFAEMDDPIDDSNPFFDRDPNKCVYCGICIRTCSELQNINAIDFSNRGYSTRVSTFGGGPIVESRCESCGECVVRCPVGALLPKTTEQPAREVKSVCTYCGVGCGILLGVRGHKIVSVRGDGENIVNRGSLCVKGRYGFGFINSPERLTKPLIRKNGELVEAEWDEALDFAAEKLKSCKSDEVAVFASAKCTNEDNYVIQKFSRAVLGTNSVDHCARL